MSLVIMMGTRSLIRSVKRWRIKVKQWFANKKTKKYIDVKMEDEQTLSSKPDAA